MKVKTEIYKFSMHLIIRQRVPLVSELTEEPSSVCSLVGFSRNVEYDQAYYFKTFQECLEELNKLSSSYDIMSVNILELVSLKEA